MTDDMELVRQYAAHQSESAFAALVSRHTNLVYSTSLRRVRNPQLAEEVTQAVFIILARKAGSLGDQTILPGWLYRTACFVSGSALKQELRRQQREQEAYMQSTLNEAGTDAAWKQMSPLLEEAMLRLGRTDRDALVLRFFEGRSLSEVGAALGASEDAAKKRVNRAVEKLRGFFTKRGVVVPAAVLATAISANSVQAAPAMLAKTATAVAFAKGATASTSTLTLIKGALRIMVWSKAKTAIVVGVAAILVAGTTTTLIVHRNHPAVAQTDFPRASWKNAGYADPVSAFETAFWASSQNDGKTLLASLSPDLQQQLGLNLTRAGISPEDFLSQDKNTASHLNGVAGFHVVKSEVVSDGEVRLHLSIEGKQGEKIFKMKKVGDGWKMDDFPTGF